MSMLNRENYSKGFLKFCFYFTDSYKQFLNNNNTSVPATLYSCKLIQNGGITELNTRIKSGIYSSFLKC